MTSQKKLILLRHATAEIGLTGIDRDRNLTPHGKAEAVSTGRKLISSPEGWAPDLILASDATRARQTLEELKTGLNYEGEVVFQEDFYSCSPDKVLNLSLETKDEVGCLLLLGHNPTWSDLIGMLSGQARALAPANAALLTCDADSWATALAPAPWSLSGLITP